MTRAGLLHAIALSAVYAISVKGETYSHSQAAAALANAGIGVSSSGGCSNRHNSRCTSLDGIQGKAIRDVITLKRASGCAVQITGGTETGHAGRSTYSHWGGWKLDVRMNQCLRNYVTRNFRHVGGGFYCASSGNTYFDERNHFDINYGRSGKC